MTVGEVIEGVFADDDSEQEKFFSESDSDSSEGVSSEDLSAKEIGTDNIHSATSITQHKEEVCNFLTLFGGSNNR